MLTLRVMTHPPFATVNMPSKDIVLDWYEIRYSGKSNNFLKAVCFCPDCD